MQYAITAANCMVFAVFLIHARFDREINTNQGLLSIDPSVYMMTD
jgi:hypothetical protein